MVHPDPRHPASPAAATVLGTTPGAPPTAHPGEPGVPAACFHPETTDSAVNWEAAWIDLGGEG